MSIERQAFGRTVDGTVVDLYTLAHPGGLQATVMTYGGTLVGLRVPDRHARPADVVLGFDTFEPYLARHPYFGSLVGRYANRIAGGTFRLDGVVYTLAQNNGTNHLHGGIKGFDKVVWQAREYPSASVPALELSYLSRDGEEGYPGNLAVTVTYTLTAGGELRIDYRATTDRETPLNLTNHAYFNLAGCGDVLAHQIQIAAQHFLPVDERLIPTGELRPVRGTPMDFTTPQAIGARIGARIGEDDRQMHLAAGGYDHTWVLDKDGDGGTGKALTFAAHVYEPASGRTMEVYTTQPGVQFYTANFLDGSLTGKGQQVYHKHQALCLETQHFPDSPNQPHFPSTVLRPGETYRQTTVYRFSTDATQA